MAAAIIPVFNGAVTIAQAIDSVLAQEFDGGVELIVVDDGSTDDTAEIVGGYGARITLVESGGRGPAAARNIGVAVSRGEYVAFLDADDTWLPGKLARMVPALARDRDCVMIYSDA
ncbi:MAG: glycosyltransferase family 2 protein, partial [Candidatus Binataceae bacterium]